jgi:upstream activation factor subunit UAF30
VFSTKPAAAQPPVWPHSREQAEFRLDGAAHSGEYLPLQTLFVGVFVRDLLLESKYALNPSAWRAEDILEEAILCRQEAGLVNDPDRSKALQARAVKLVRAAGEAMRQRNSEDNLMPTKPAKAAESPKPSNPLQKPVKPSAELAAIVGPQPLARSEVVSKVWDYIKSHNLQNPENRREIVADAKLRSVFGKGKVTMFEMNRHLANHLK